ncbi:hypothetical protein Tco_0189923 [Tanacetum coccineum]
MAAGSRDRPPMLATGRICTMAITEVNELRAERMAKNANPLTLVATAQTLQDPYYQTSKPHKSYAPHQKLHFLTRFMQLQDTKAKSSQNKSHHHLSQLSEEDSDPGTSSEVKDIQNKNVDTTPRYKNDNQTGQFGNQRAVMLLGLEKLNSESQKGLKTPRITRKRCCYVNKLRKLHGKDQGGSYARPQEVIYEHWKNVQYDTDDNVFANDIQHFDQSESISNTCVMETDDSNVTPASPDMCDNDI